MDFTHTAYGQLAELDEDLSVEQVSVDSCNTSELVESTGHSEDVLVPFPLHASQQQSTPPETLEEYHANIYSESEGETQSPLPLYFKSINQFPLLSNLGLVLL